MPDTHEDALPRARRRPQDAPQEDQPGAAGRPQGSHGVWAFESLQYFRAHREVSASARPREPQRNAAKVGRNAPCPCGSGRKYKKCCGGATVNQLSRPAMGGRPRGNKVLQRCPRAAKVLPASGGIPGVAFCQGNSLVRSLANFDWLRLELSGHSLVTRVRLECEEHQDCAKARPTDLESTVVWASARCGSKCKVLRAA